MSTKEGSAMSNVSDSNITPQMHSILTYLKKERKATTKDIAMNVPGIPRNRAVVENMLLKLFMMDELIMARAGRVKFWSPNHVVIHSNTTPLATAFLPEYDKEGKDVRKFWFNLNTSTTRGDYIYVKESRFIEGGGWVQKGGIVLPISMVVDYIFNILKIAIKSPEFKESHKEVYPQLESFLKEISLHVGTSPIEVHS